MIKNLFISLLMALMPVLYIAADNNHPVWVIDAGHGGHDVGCMGMTSYEKDITLRVAKEVASMVRSRMPRVKVILTRENDRYLSLNDRCHIANRAQADLFLSIHVNSTPDNNNVRGTETYYAPNTLADISLQAARRPFNNHSELLARSIQMQYSMAGRPSKRGAKQNDYFVVKHALMPSVLTEIGFISTPDEEGFMNSDEGLRLTSESIYKGLKEYQDAVTKGNDMAMLKKLRVTPLSDGLPTWDMAASTVNTEREVTQMKQMPAPETKTLAEAKTAKPAQPAKAPAKAAKPEPAKEAPAKAAEPAKTEIAAVKTPVVEWGIQLFSVKAPLNEGDKRLMGLTPVLYKKGVDGAYKCVYANSGTMPTKTQLAEVRKLFPDAFIVAYMGDKSISITDAMQMAQK